MSLDLEDLKRLKITAETRAWLEAAARSSGRTKQEVARDALHQIAVEKIHEARMLSGLAPAHVSSGDGRGRAP